uniref:TCF3 (E2A) fusion partner n=1 Tax=Sinocyclocheilus anshuiensis TaxID=1608454 RepID=A0A671RC21_9TELE
MLSLCLISKIINIFICKPVVGYAVILTQSFCLSVDVLQMMEDFSGLALPPLFGGHILEAELETGGVELGPSGTELLDSDGAPSGPAQDREDERRELDHSKYHALSKRCKEIEQVNEKILGRLHQVQRLTRRLRKERKYTLDSYGDDYRTAQLTITLEVRNTLMIHSSSFI